MLMIRIPVHGLFRWHVRIATTLIAIFFLTQIGSEVTGKHRMFGLVQLFAVYNDDSIPSFFQSTVLAFCGALALLIAQQMRQEPKWFRRWTALGGAFLWISVDSFTSIHEGLKWAVSYYATKDLWMLVWYTLLGGVLLYVGPIVLAAPRPIARLLVKAGLIYIVGKVTGDFVSAEFLQHGMRFMYGIMYGWKKAAEFVGMAFCLRALLLYIEHAGYAFGFRPSSDTAEPRPSGAPRISASTGTLRSPMT